MRSLSSGVEPLRSVSAVIATCLLVSAPVTAAPTQGADTPCEMAADIAVPSACKSPPISNSSNSTDLACDTGASLMDIIACIKSASPAADTQAYVFPTVTESQQFAGVVQQMAGDMDDGIFDCDAPVPAGLVDHYRVTLVESGGREFCVLHEFLDADLDGYADLGWGTFIFAPDADNELNLQAPHSRADLYTETEVVDLFERSRSRSALVAGAHRDANSAASICQGHMLRSNGEPYSEADAAHNIDTFYAAARAISAHYGAIEVGGVVDLTGVHPDYYALQFHGMGASSCSNLHVFMSNGASSSVVPSDAAHRLATVLQQQNPQWNIGHPGDGTSTCNLYGSHNTLSRYLNGVEDNGTNDVDNPICSHSGDLPAVSTRFIHIEQKRCLSGTACSYGDADTIRTAASWAGAIIQAFDAPTCTDQLLNGDEQGIDCGGSCPLACEPAQCVPAGDGLGCDDTTPCCGGPGSCTKGKPSQRVCQ